MTFKDMLPLYETYVQTHYEENYEIDECNKDTLVREMNWGYAYIMTIYRPRNRCKGNDFSKIIDYVFEYTYMSTIGFYDPDDPKEETEASKLTKAYVLSIMVRDNVANF